MAQETFSSLNILADAWSQTQKYRRQLIAGDKSWEKAFDQHYNRLNAARERLCGIAADLPSREIDQGQVLEGSLLHRLRTATSSL